VRVAFSFLGLPFVGVCCCIHCHHHPHPLWRLLNCAIPSLWYRGLCSWYLCCSLSLVFLMDASECASRWSSECLRVSLLSLMLLRLLILLHFRGQLQLEPYFRVAFRFDENEKNAPLTAVSPETAMSPPIQGRETNCPPKCVRRFACAPLVFSSWF
jgi:hypothetical protein